LDAELRISLGDRSYSISIAPGAWRQLPLFLESSDRKGKLLVVTDDRVGPLYEDRLGAILKQAGFAADFYRIPEGEVSKSFSEIERLERTMSSSGFDRDSLVLAMGGGVVGDLAGFAASVYLRGVLYVQLPTSLLAMVDSSVGGKTGINIPEGKNLVGTFYQPGAVYIDTETLSTLDERDWYSGMAEVIKIALSLDPELFEYLMEFQDLGPSGGVDPVRVIHAACRRKAEVVEADETETGLRRVLNFGHTIAHALEAACGYGKIRHGEAVALGMKAALTVSASMTGLPESQLTRAMDLLSRIPVPAIDVGDDLYQYIIRDKKSSEGSVTAVLLESIGTVKFVPLPNPSILVEALLSSQ
jgi:3-dehydroquinate synthase